jgi:TetR/AcrR family transcriptional regulator
MGMGQQRKEVDQPEVDVRRSVLESAVRLFNTKGYAATTVREIVERAGVSKPVLYYYFGNKEGVFLELVRGSYEELVTALDVREDDGETARERIASLFDRVYSLTCEHIEGARMMYSLYYGPPSGAPYFDFDVYHRAFVGAVLKLVKEGVEKGEWIAENIGDVAWAIIGGLSVAVEVQLSHPEASLGRDGLSRVLKVIFDGICSAPTGRSMQRKGVPDA